MDNDPRAIANKLGEIERILLRTMAEGHWLGRDPHNEINQQAHDRLVSLRLIEQVPNNLPGKFEVVAHRITDLGRKVASLAPPEQLD